MDKNIIKKHLNQTFVSEAKAEKNTPGISMTNAVHKKSGEENKKGVKDIDKNLSAYEGSLKKGMETTKVPNKFNYNGEKEIEYHDQMEIMNGQEMIQYDRTPNKEFTDRALEALEGSTRMGNKGGKDMGNAEETWGASSDDFGKKLAKNAKASFKKRLDAETGLMSFGDDVEVVPKGTKPMGKHSALGENKDNNKPQIKESMKRLKFNNEFKGVGNALKMIPESYKVDNKTFEMTDGVENYKIRWEGTLTEGRAVVLMASDKTMVNEDMAHMKHLMGYKSQETLGTVKGKARLDENAAFSDIWSKTRDLMEGTDIESAKAKTGNLEDIKKKTPEATKHVQGSVSKDKGTQAPAAKEGDLDDAVSHAPEAKKHVEGSVSTEKGTKAPAPKNGNWEDVKKKSADATKHVTLKESEEKEEEEEEGTEDVTTEEVAETKEVKTEGSDIEGTKASKTAPWEDHNVKHAAEAKKHIMNMTEGVKLGENFFAPLSEEMDDYDVDVKKKDEEITEGMYEEGLDNLNTGDDIMNYNAEEGGDYDEFTDLDSLIDSLERFNRNNKYELDGRESEYFYTKPMGHKNTEGGDIYKPIDHLIINGDKNGYFKSAEYHDSNSHVEFTTADEVLNWLKTGFREFKNLEEGMYENKMEEGIYEGADNNSDLLIYKDDIISMSKLVGDNIVEYMTNPMHNEYMKLAHNVGQLQTVMNDLHDLLRFLKK